MKTKKNSNVIHYQLVSYEDEQGPLEFFVFSGNLDLLKKCLEDHKDVLKLIGKLTKATLNAHGEEVMKDIKLNETILTCDDISLYIKG